MTKVFLIAVLSLFIFIPIYYPSASVSDTCVLESSENPIPDPVKPLRSCKDATLQDALNQVLNENQSFRRLISQKRLAIGLVDMRKNADAKMASVNGEEMMYAASLPKIAILFAAMDALDKGELIDSPEIQSDLHLMIAKSNNQASTRMIDRVGYDKIESILTDPQYALYDKNHGGGLWVGKRYAAGGARNPEPMKGLSHAATVDQICRYYYLMANGKLVNEARSAQMMDIMTEPKLHHKFVNTLDKIAPDAQLFRKSGSWSNFHSDSVMVKGKDRNYILSALVEDPNGEQIIRKLVYSVEKAMQLCEANCQKAAQPKLAQIIN